MRRLGCLVFLLGVALAFAECYSFVIASRLLRTHAADLIGGNAWVDTVLPLILLQVALIVLGVVVVRRAIAQLPTAMLGSLTGQNADAGKLMLSLLGGILLIIPGFFLDCLGILLLLPPVQALLARPGQRLVMALVRRHMAKMFPGGMPGGGFPMGGFRPPFPGMQPRGPLAPDERIPRGPVKVIDTTAERVDRT